VLKINFLLGEHRSLQEMFEQILQCALSLTDAERALIILQQGARQSVAKSCSWSNRTAGASREKYSKAIVTRVIKENRSIFFADDMENNHVSPTNGTTQHKPCAILCVPIFLDGSPTGVIYLDHQFKPQAFAQPMLPAVEALAILAGIALDHDQSHRAIAEQKKEIIRLTNELEQAHQKLNTILVGKMPHAEVAPDPLSDTAIEQIDTDHATADKEIIQRYQTVGIWGHSKVMCVLYRSVSKVVDTDLPIYLYGESGTGKELVARAIHQLSARREQPFVSVNCSAIPANLLESELFGHQRGTFTGAVRDRLGLFELAGKGTLFLDEVGDMPLEMQAKLLRVLQEGTFRRLGDEIERQSYCRIISASNKELNQLVEQKLFRQDLLYRLIGIYLSLPSLRERREDIPLLAEHILASSSKKTTISPAAMAALLDYDWPGNVRQLEHELLRASLLSDGVIEPSALTIPTAQYAAILSERSMTLQEAMAEFECKIIEAALDETQGNVVAAAQRLGMHRGALYRKIQQHQIVRTKTSTI
jgi:transcriptional regulator with GAF, ATPase, and Fis domain